MLVSALWQITGARPLPAAAGECRRGVLSFARLPCRRGDPMSAKLVSIEDARSRILAEALPLPAETVPLPEAVGSVLAEDIIASHSVPPFDNSGMDGYAVRAADLVDAAPGSPTRLLIAETIPAGHVATRSLAAGEAARIMTGAPMPQGADTVVAVGDHLRGRRVRPDLRSGQAGQEHPARGRRRRSRATGCSAPARRSGPAEIGVLASLGHPQVLGPPAAPRGHHLHGQRTGGGRPAAWPRADPQLQQLLAAGALPADGRRGDVARHRPR